MNLQEAIKKLRVELGLTQKELAGLLDVDQMSVYRWENGRCFPKTRAAERILRKVDYMDVSDECRAGFAEALSVVRRKGKSADDCRFPEIDQDLLCQIVEESANAIYVIEVGTYKILYVNRTTETLASNEIKDIADKRCYEYMRNKDKPCENCPLRKNIGYEYTEQIVKNYNDDRYLRVRGKRMKWNGKDVFISYVSNVTELVNAKQKIDNTEK